MYSLYKQATCGNVQGQRPGMWDMLGRAKWDAWAKHKDLDPLQAKWLYVEALLKVLRKYSDKTVAKKMVEELESYGASSTALSRTLSAESDSSGSTASDEDFVVQYHSTTNTHEHDSLSEEEQDQPRELPVMNVEQDPSQGRPQSAMSSRRYRTPMADSLAMSPQPAHSLIAMQGIVPVTQPMPGFETPSAFAEPSPISAPSSLYPTSSYVPLSQSSQLTSPPPDIFPTHPVYHGTPQPLPAVRQYGPVRPVSQSTLERAVQHMQAQIAALNERLETLESLSRHPSRSHLSLSPRDTPTWGAGSSHRRDQLRYDLDDLGMWSLIVEPVSRGMDRLRELARFFAKDDTRSPSMIIVRRLVFDISFLMFVLGSIRLIWKKSGVRRREVYAALIVLWRAIMGIKPPPRRMVDRGV